MIHLLSIILDGMPFLPQQLAIFEQLKSPWLWHCVEGAAANVHDTRWCRAQEPRLSRDGSSEWINAHINHPNIRIYRKQLWDGKREMVNAPLATIKEPSSLLQVDCDEIWKPWQIDSIHELLTNKCVRMSFVCNYYVGENIVVTPENDPVNNIWLRAWRFTPGDTFLAHEPPTLKQQATGPVMSQHDTHKLALVFDHFSYRYEHQVAYKEAFYGYPNAVQKWRRLQENKTWPVSLRSFLPWAKPGAKATLVTP